MTERKLISFISSYLVRFFLIGVSLSLINCTMKSSVNRLSPKVEPSKRSFIYNTDLQGVSSTVQSSDSAVMSIHSFGGSSQRTEGESANYRLTSGIGVD